MAVFDDNWASYCMYTTTLVESSGNYGCIEKSVGRGIGIAQWSNGRSWILLNMLVTDYPNIGSQMPILYNKIKPGSSPWGDRIFTSAEQNEISKVLITDEGVATQNKLWKQDLEKDYIPLLKKYGIDNVKGSIYALTVYHQSPRAFSQIVWDANNGSYERWYNLACANGIVGKYRTRQNTVKQALASWDGESGKEGFGVKDEDITDGGDLGYGGGNPDNTTSLTNTDVKAIEQRGNLLFLQVGKQKITFRKSATNFYYPYKADWETEQDDKVPQNPDETVKPKPEGKMEEMIEHMKSIRGTINYTQSMELRQDIPGGFADCSSLCWWHYKNYFGVDVGTWTGAQKNNGKLIQTGGSGVALDTSKVKPGDLILIAWSGGRESIGHVEMYTGDNELWGINSPKQLGPTPKNAYDYTTKNYPYWEARRYVD